MHKLPLSNWLCCCIGLLFYWYVSTQWRCQSCKVGGNVASMVAWAYRGDIRAVPPVESRGRACVQGASEQSILAVRRPIKCQILLSFSEFSVWAQTSKIHCPITKAYVYSCTSPAVCYYDKSRAVKRWRHLKVTTAWLLHMQLCLQ